MTVSKYNIVREFEQTIADYTGARYGIAVESGTMAIFLSLLYRQIEEDVWIPRFTYPSVGISIINAGGKVRFTDEDWQGMYELWPVNVWDAALRFKKNMMVQGKDLALVCLSFHEKKHLKIGRGGMILTNDEKASKWLRLARFDGRQEIPLKDQKDITVLGFNAYMTPEQAKRGLKLFEKLKDQDLPDLDRDSQNYPDLSKFTIFK